MSGKPKPPVRIIPTEDCRGWWCRVRIAGRLVHLTTFFRRPQDAVRAAERWAEGAGALRGHGERGGE